MVESPSKVHYPALGLAIDSAKEAIKAQLDEVGTANTRAQFLMGFTGLAVAAFGQVPTTPLSLLWAIPAVATIWLAFKAYEPLGMLAGLGPAAIRDEMLLDDPDAVRLVMVDTALEAISHNAKLLERKHRFIRWGVTSFVATVLMMILARVIGG